MAYNLLDINGLTKLIKKIKARFSGVENSIQNIKAGTGININKVQNQSGGSTADDGYEFYENTVSLSEDIQNKLDELNATIFYWDGKSSTDNPKNLELWTEIYNKSKNEGKTCLVYSSIGAYADGQALFVIKDWEPDMEGGSGDVEDAYYSFSSLINDFRSSYNSDNGSYLRYSCCIMSVTISTNLTTNVTAVSDVEALQKSNIKSSNFLTTSSKQSLTYTPTYDYHPTTKKYVDDKFIQTAVPTFTNSSESYSYTFVLNNATNLWESNNNGVDSSTAGIVFTPTTSIKDKQLMLFWKVSSESNYDKLNINIKGTNVISNTSGEKNGIITIPALTTSDTITVTYTKDSSSHKGSDKAYIKIFNADSISIAQIITEINKDTMINEVNTSVNNTLNTKLDTKLDKNNPVATGSFSLSRKADTTVGPNSMAIGLDITASGAYSMAQGYQTISQGLGTLAEGWGSLAAGQACHAEGRNTKAFAPNSHVEGHNTYTRGGANVSKSDTDLTQSYTSEKGGEHAEGYNTTAVGYGGSHAEGYSSNSLITLLGDNPFPTDYASIVDLWNTNKFLAAIVHGSNSGTSGYRCCHAEGVDTLALKIRSTCRR